MIDPAFVYFLVLNKGIHAKLYNNNGNHTGRKFTNHSTQAVMSVVLIYNFTGISSHRKQSVSHLSQEVYE